MATSRTCGPGRDHHRRRPRRPTSKVRCIASSQYMERGGGSAHTNFGHLRVRTLTELGSDRLPKFLLALRKTAFCRSSFLISFSLALHFLLMHTHTHTQMIDDRYRRHHQPKYSSTRTTITATTIAGDRRAPTPPCRCRRRSCTRGRRTRPR